MTGKYITQILVQFSARGCIMRAAVFFVVINPRSFTDNIRLIVLDR